jgi:antitoxin HicB
MVALEYLFITSVLPEAEDGGYLIEYPDLPGCMSDGETIQEAIENGKDAVRSWIEMARAHGHEIPPLGSSSTSSCIF